MMAYFFCPSKELTVHIITPKGKSPFFFFFFFFYQKGHTIFFILTHDRFIAVILKHMNKLFKYSVSIFTMVNELRGRVEVGKGGGTGWGGVEGWGENADNCN